MSSNRCPLILLTGGPQSGKSRTLRTLQSARCHGRIQFIEETATRLLHAGLPLPLHLDLSTPEWNIRVQPLIAQFQLMREQAAQKAAQTSQAAFILTDRGLFDSASYLPNGLPQLATILHTDPAALMARYDLVLHLPSVAVTHPDQWRGSDHTTVRIEDSHAAAVRAEERLAGLCATHPKYQRIDGETFQERFARICSILAPYLPELANLPPLSEDTHA